MSEELSDTEIECSMESDKAPPASSCMDVLQWQTALESSICLIFKFIIILFSCIGVFCLYVCLCTICVSSALRGQKRALDPLELELEVVGSCHMGARN